MATHFLVSPLSLQMMDPKIPNQGPGEQEKAIRTFVSNFMFRDPKKDGTVTMRVRRERIEGANKYTYRTYFDKRPHSMRYTEAEFDLYPVVRSYRKYLVLQNGAVAKALIDIKQDKHYDIELRNVEDIPSVAKVITEAAADNIKAFASAANKRVMGAVDNNVALDSDQFYAASIYITRLPKGMLNIPSLTKESLGYDMFTMAVAPHAHTNAEMDALRTFAEAAKDLSDDDRMFYVSVMNMNELLKADVVRVHLVSMCYTVYARDPEQLEEKVANLQRKLPIGVYAEWLPVKQYELYKYGMPEPYHKKSFKMPTSHLAVAYPPMADLLEMSGIYYGTNWLTQSAVYVDSALRDNGIEVIVGKPGGGKSVFLKVTTERHEASMPGATTHIWLDPSETQEYKPLVDRVNAMRSQDKVEWRTIADGLGIDVLRYGPTTATNILGKLFGIAKEHVLMSMLFQVCETAIEKKRGVLELEDVARANYNTDDRDAAALVAAVHKGLKSYGRIFQGEMPPGSFCFNVYSPEQNDLEVAAAISITMLRARELFHEQEASKPKMLIIDEGYLALADQESRIALDKMSRQMRKKGLRLRFATQRPGDLAALAAKDSSVYETAVAIIEDSDMQVLFPHPNLAYLRELLSLSNYVINILKPSAHDTRAGRCVLIVGSGKTGRRISHTIVQIDATPEQLVAYNTDPTKQETRFTTDTRAEPPAEKSHPKIPIRANEVV